MISKNEAQNLLYSKLSDQNLRRHSLATAIIMSKLAEKFQEDTDEWFITGILHDIDLEEVNNDMDLHGLEAMKILKDYDVPDSVKQAILSHNKKAELENLLDKGLWISDPVNGLIIATALMMPDKKISSVKLKSLKKKFKSNNFAASVDRDQISYCENLDISLDDFLGLALNALGEKEQELGF